MAFPLGDPFRPVVAQSAYRVLLVEDNPAEAELVFERLSSASPGAFDLTHVFSMEEASAACVDTRFDCVVLDLQLPDTGGVETIRTMKARARDAAIVAYSGLDDERARAASIEEGAQDFIGKNGPEAGSLDRSILFALERRRAIKLHAQFEELFRAHPDAMIVVGEGGAIRFANHAAEPLLRSGDRLARVLLEALDAEAGEIEFLLHGELHIGEIRVVACTWDGEPARLAAIRDITDQKLLSARYRKLKRMQTIGRFAGGLAHDFGNVVACIDVLASVASAGLDPQSPHAQRLSDIQTAAASGRGIVQQLLSLEKSQQHTPEVVDPRHVLGRIEQILRPVLPADIDLRVECAPDAPTICVDASNIEQALLNLAFNAREAMPTGGILRISCTRAAEGIEFCVSDTGQGIAPEKLPHVFELFHSSKPRGGGHGLGLAICQSIAEQAGGTISVDSRPGAGAVFTIRLPLTPQTSATPGDLGRDDLSRFRRRQTRER